MSDATERPDARDVAVVGNGIAGCAAALFTARAGLDTAVLAGGESILASCAHLENVLGFPRGVPPAAFLAAAREQVRHAGADVRDERAVGVERSDGRFRVESSEDAVVAERVVAASWPAADWLDDLDVAVEEENGHDFLDGGPEGRTAVEGLYVAGRLAAGYHQALVAAGDGATAGISVVRDARPDFYNDWVAPEGYFTNHGYDVPPGVEEIDGAERERRAERARRALRSHYAEE